MLALSTHILQFNGVSMGCFELLRNSEVVL